jgi:hypothetical protein
MKCMARLDVAIQQVFLKFWETVREHSGRRVLIEVFVLLVAENKADSADICLLQ